MSTGKWNTDHILLILHLTPTPTKKTAQILSAQHTQLHIVHPVFVCVQVCTERCVSWEKKTVTSGFLFVWPIA